MYSQPNYLIEKLHKKFYFKSSKCKHIKDSSSSVDKIFIETLKRDDTVQIKLHWGCHERLLIFFQIFSLQKGIYLWLQKLGSLGLLKTPSLRFFQAAERLSISEEFDENPYFFENIF